MVNSKLNRVVITGLGAVTPLGNTVTQYWQGLLQGRSGIEPITLSDASNCTCQIAGEVKGFDPCNYLKRKDAERMDRFVQFAVCASQQAITDAGIEINDLNNTSIGVLIGTGFGGIKVVEDQEKVYLTCGPKYCSPSMMSMALANMAAGLTAIHTGAKGPNSCTVTACAAGSNAIGEAFRLIQGGYAKAMICGGTEAPITPLSIAGFTAARALSTRNHEPTRASRPFDRDRDGFVMGEGSGILLLEELEHAQRRGAHIYAEIVGYRQTCDAYHITAPVPGGEGAAKAMQLSLQDAGLSSSQVDYINAHGTSTFANDVTETLAIKKALGQYASQVAISSTKSMTGHLLGGSGGIEAVATVMTIATDNIPPTINLDYPDPDCDLDFVPNLGRNQLVKVALSNSFGFGGHNVTLTFQKFSD
jgi:3-oxoacyl-[acyl-carrier-protein] synthase II